MPLVLATAGRFELMATCYVPKCTNEADHRSSGGPICHKHWLGQRIYDLRQEGYYRVPQSWTAKELAEEAAIRAEIAALEATEKA